MTSSDQTRLDPAAPEAFAARVGRSVEGSADAGVRVGFVCAKFNGGVTTRLLDGALGVLEAHGVDLRSVTVTWVPGAFEVPLAAQALAASGSVEAVVTLGAVIRGDTPHFDYVAGPCAEGVSRVALDTGVPVVFGVLTTDTVAQALERSRPGPSNKGAEAAMTALEMAGLLVRLARPPAPVGAPER